MNLKSFLKAYTVNKDIILLKYAAFKAKLNTGRIQLS